MNQRSTGGARTCDVVGELVTLFRLQCAGRVVTITAFLGLIHAGAAVAAASDLLCKASKRPVAFISESTIGTVHLANDLNVFKEAERPSSGKAVAVYVNVRKCIRSQDVEFETWLSSDSRKRGGAAWVPLVGSISRFDGNRLWFVGNSLPGGADLLAHLQANRPEPRLVRLYFQDSALAPIESGKLGELQVAHASFKWAQIRKGELVNLPDGRSVPVTADLAGIEATLALVSKASRPESYPDEFYWVRDGNELLSKRLTCKECKDLRPGETRTVQLLPHMQPPDPAARSSPGYLVNLRTGLRIALPPLK